MSSVVKRRKYSPQEKFTIVVESLRGDTTIEQVCGRHSVHPTQVMKWRKVFRENGSIVFADQRNPKGKALANGFAPGQSPDELKKIIGDLVIQNEILKKVQGLLR